SMLSGANLSLGDIYRLAMKLENEELGNITGEQGLLSTFLGGIQQHIWTGQNGDAYPVSFPLFTGDEQEVQQKLKNVSEHILLAQAGIHYSESSKVIERLSVVINQMWNDLLTKDSHIALPIFRRKIKLASQWAWALNQGDFKTAVRVTM